MVPTQKFNLGAVQLQRFLQQACPQENGNMLLTPSYGNMEHDITPGAEAYFLSREMPPPLAYLMCLSLPTWKLNSFVLKNKVYIFYGFS